MIIESPGHREVQVPVSPVVYLDHWALGDISENQTLTDHLTAALKSRNGTLALSWLQLREFSKMTNEAQARDAENLIKDILPQIFFLEVHFDAVISREDEQLACPHRDEDLFEEFIKSQPRPRNQLTVRNLFKVMQEDRQGAQRHAKLAGAIVDCINVMRSKLATKQGRKDRDSFIKSALLEFQPVIKHSQGDWQIQRGTRFICYELIRSLFIDMQKTICQNDVDDIFHAVVPVAYCDFVLLDGHWKTQVERAHARLKKVVPSVSIARVFSRRANGLDQFLCELESGR